jgi:hypothetical protein
MADYEDGEGEEVINMSDYVVNSGPSGNSASSIVTENFQKPQEIRVNCLPLGTSEDDFRNWCRTQNISTVWINGPSYAGLRPPSVRMTNTNIF